MGEWRSVSLGDCVDLLSGFAFKSAKFSSDPSDVRLVRGDNIVQGAMRWNGAVRWPAGEIAEYSKFELREGDVVLAMDRPWIEAGLKWCCLRADDVPSLLVQRVARLRSTDGVCQGFIRAVIGSPEFTAYIKTIITGANVPHISGPDIRKYRFRIPPLETQRRIAAVLSAYDDLIENNARRIRVLEEMARAVYREWFERASVHLGEGWSLKDLGDVAEVNRAVISPKSAPDTIRYVDIASVSPGHIEATAPMSFADAPGRARRIVQHGDTIWSCVRPNRRSHAMVLNQPSDTVVSTGFAVLTPTKITPAYLYLATTTDEFVGYLTAHATGAAYPAVTGSVFEKASIVVPPENLLQRFEEIAMPLLECAELLRKKNRALRAARDLLLPKLLSGELSVDRIPDPAEAAE